MPGLFPTVRPSTDELQLCARALGQARARKWPQHRDSPLNPHRSTRAAGSSFLFSARVNGPNVIGLLSLPDGHWFTSSRLAPRSAHKASVSVLTLRESSH